jgi:hypothetical protein
MFSRWIVGAVVGVSAVLFGAGCGDTVEAQDTTSSSPVVQEPLVCGGIQGIPCPTGQVCVYPDDCDPEQGGSDCSGICQDAPHKLNRCNKPGRTYVSRDPAQCAAILFFCEPGKTVFFDECGCGCETRS